MGQAEDFERLNARDMLTGETLWVRMPCARCANNVRISRDHIGPVSRLCEECEREPVDGVPPPPPEEGEWPKRDLTPGLVGISPYRAPPWAYDALEEIEDLKRQRADAWAERDEAHAKIVGLNDELRQTRARLSERDAALLRAIANR